MGLSDLGASTGWFHWSYLVDWAVTIAFGAIVYFPTTSEKPHCKDFNPLDPALGHPYSEHEGFPNWSLPLVAGVAPIVYGALLIIYIQWRRPAHLRKATTGHHMHALILCIFQALVFATALTNLLKQYMGRHRPDFIARLESALDFDKHAYNMSDPASVADMMSLVCGSDAKDVKDGMRSFPSGHASYSFAGWTVVALMLISVIPWRVASYPAMPKILLAFTPMILPAIVAGSRTRDNRHNYDDILAGSVIGVVFGIVAYMGHYKLGSPDPVNRRTGHNASSTAELDASDGEDPEKPREMDKSGSRSSSHINVPYVEK